MTNPRLLSADREFGADKQENIIHSLRNYFQSSNIEATKDKYCIYHAWYEVILLFFSTPAFVQYTAQTPTIALLSFVPTVS
jgi:hypothetical protein